MGGTISAARTGDSAEVSPSLKAEALIASIPVLSQVAQVEWGDVTTMSSRAVRLEDMHAVARETVKALDEGCDGVVVTHGTDTIEETAYALALMVPRGKPVVVTGAMRNPTLPGADGPANLAEAFMAAARPEAGRLGPVVLLNDEVHAARFATKSHSTRPSSFVSAGAGPIGEVIEGRAYFWFAPTYDDYLGMPDDVPSATVPLIKVASGVDDLLLRAAIDQTPPAIVIECFGSGYVPLTLLDAIDAAVTAGISIVMAPRALAGRTVDRSGGMHGAEMHLIDRGMIPAGHISGHKARLRVMVGLALCLDVRSLFPIL
jgi:L-asparaginase